MKPISACLVLFETLTLILGVRRATGRPCG